MEIGLVKSACNLLMTGLLDILVNRRISISIDMHG